MGNKIKPIQKALPETALTFLFVTGKNILETKGIRSALRGMVRKITTGSREKPYHDVQTVEGYADAIMDILEKKRISPESIGIDGPPGSGKSTLGRSLAKRTGLEWQTLYLNDINNPHFIFKSGKIYENIRLFRTKAINNFDLIIYINCPIEDAQYRVIERDRNGALADYVDFRKLKKIGDAAFEMADGEEIRVPMSPIRIKIKPEGGYGDMDNLRMKLEPKGLNTDMFSKEELLFMDCYGKAKKGIMSYVNWGAYNNEISSAAYEALRILIGKKR